MILCLIMLLTEVDRVSNLGLIVNQSVTTYFTTDDTGEVSDANVMANPSYSLSQTEAIALSFMLFYYLFLVFLGVLSWLRARQRVLRKRKDRKVPLSPHFELNPNQLHIRYCDDDSM
ncbi:hypothetical protein D915_004165 [Fasciola hepatica]|uniref:Uncharacterized protein n=1 Tax=Fasciola hepatica TaxID=6192 RepID=A0A4E0RUX1_FASHE|nr:hypothetical protein D915_004165 [Fasciola hepatica]